MRIPFWFHQVTKNGAHLGTTLIDATEVKSIRRLTETEVGLKLKREFSECEQWEITMKDGLIYYSSWNNLGDLFINCINNQPIGY